MYLLTLSYIRATQRCVAGLDHTTCRFRGIACIDHAMTIQCRLFEPLGLQLSKQPNRDTLFQRPLGLSDRSYFPRFLRHVILPILNRASDLRCISPMGIQNVQGIKTTSPSL
jgi:hypothetical protein